MEMVSKWTTRVAWGRGPLSDVVSNLLSGVVGALVGGIASLGGSVLVNKQQRNIAVCQRVYSELPKVMDSWGKIQVTSKRPGGSTYDSAVDKTFQEIGRISPLAGRRVNRRVDAIWTDYANWIIDRAEQREVREERIWKGLKELDDYLKSRLG
jgi:hypothetical protein